MTTGQPADAEPDAAQCAVLFDRLHHVNRARRFETAHRRQQRREKSLVKTKRCESKGAHGSSGNAQGGDALQRALQVDTVLPPIGLRRVRLDVHDEIERAAVEPERTALPAIDLASPSLQPVAHVCLAAFLRGGDPDPRIRQPVGGEKENAVAGKEFATGFVHAKKLAAFRQSFLFRQSLGAGGKSAGIG
jgi:hypothetical protein